MKLPWLSGALAVLIALGITTALARPPSGSRPPTSTPKPYGTLAPYTEESPLNSPACKEGALPSFELVAVEQGLLFRTWPDDTVGSRDLTVHAADSSRHAQTATLKLITRATAH